MTLVHYPTLYQINTRVWLTELSQQLGRSATLDNIPDDELDRLVEMGFDRIWLLSVWQPGTGAQKVSRSNPEWRREFRETLRRCKIRHGPLRLSATVRPKFAYSPISELGIANLGQKHAQ